VAVPTSCKEKLRRATELIDSLETEADAIFGSRDYLRPFLESKGGFGYGFEVKKQPPWDRWSVLATEIVHHLRSALDQLAWALSIQHSGPAPTVLTPAWRGVEFPIYTRRELFYSGDGSLHKKHAGRDLHFVDPRSVSLFDGLQPFHTSRPERHSLAVLQELWNLDKHRGLPLVAMMSPRGAVSARVLGMTGRSRAKVVPIPLPDRVVLAQLRQIQGTGPVPADMNVGARFKIDFDVMLTGRIAFAPGPPAFGGDLIKKLRTLHRATQRTIDTICRPRLI
jgi:hypothetical protein